jgi:hypothetical protein
MSSNAFGPNEERYKIASEPHADEDVAAHALHAFFHELGALREKHKIPEVVIVAAAYHGEGDYKQTVAQAAAFGNERTFPDLAAAAYRIYVLPILERAEDLAAASSNRKRKK